MKIITITVATALAVLATVWLLVRSDLLDASVLRYLPALLALVAAAGIVGVAISRKSQVGRDRTSRRKKK